MARFGQATGRRGEHRRSQLYGRLDAVQRAANTVLSIANLVSATNPLRARQDHRQSAQICLVIHKRRVSQFKRFQRALAQSTGTGE